MAALAGGPYGSKQRHPHQGEEIVIAKSNPVFKETGGTSNGGEPHLPKFNLQNSPYAHKNLLNKLTDNIHVSDHRRVNSLCQ
jgi:hypothetical protein